MRRIALRTNVVALVKAAGANEELPDPKQIDTPSEWVIWRQDLTVQYRSLDSVESAAIDAAQHDENFSLICEAIAQRGDADSAPLTAASFLKQWLTDGCVIELRRS